MSCAAQAVLETPKQSNESRQGILVVEDEPLVREVTAEVLRTAGYKVWTASDGDSATDIFEQCRSDIGLLIIDVTLPDLPGPTLAAKLSAIESGVGTLLTSGYPDKMTPDRSTLRNCVYMAKPFSADSLLRQVRKCLHETHAMSY